MTSTKPATTGPTVPAAHTEQPSIGTLAGDVSRNLSEIVRGEVKLAKAEVGSAVKNAGTGAGMFVGALVLVVFSLTFGLIALAEGLVTIGLWRWLSYLIVFGFLLLVAGILVLIGIRKVKKVKSPEKTIKQSKRTAQALKPGKTAP